MFETGFIDEPELEFGGGKRHIDIRFGISNYGTLDREERATPREIQIGVIGTPQLTDAFLNWLNACAKGVAAKASNKPNLRWSTLSTKRARTLSSVSSRSLCSRN